MSFNSADCPDWVFCRNTPTGGQEVVCKRCNTVYQPQLPCSIDMFLTIMQQFGKEHKHCEQH